MFNASGNRLCPGSNARNDAGKTTAAVSVAKPNFIF